MALAEPTTRPLFRGETPGGFAACLAPPNPARSELTPPASLRSCPRKLLRLLLKLACGLGVIMEPRDGPGKPVAFPDLWTHYPLSITQRELLFRMLQDDSGRCSGVIPTWLECANRLEMAGRTPVHQHITPCRNRVDCASAEKLLLTALRSNLPAASVGCYRLRRIFALGRTQICPASRSPIRNRPGVRTSRP